MSLSVAIEASLRNPATAVIPTHPKGNSKFQEPNSKGEFGSWKLVLGFAWYSSLQNRIEMEIP